MKRLIPTLGALAATLITSNAQIVWLNEFHYDNAGSDSGEYIENAAPSSLTSATTCVEPVANALPHTPCSPIGEQAGLSREGPKTSWLPSGLGR